MPLVRLEVRNEYGLGQPELYKETNRDDPKAVLDGVAVAGLVGILRQLGDLAEFGAEVFHGLQEQIMTTASRSHKLKVRVQRIEVALPSLEKAVLTQTSHIHFAYTAGSEWHPRIRNEQNHFIYNDLPRFIMDSYEGCRDPPRLHLLDKFDTGGPGSCLKRYSDPTFFKKVFFTSDEATEKTQANRKARRSKKKRSSQRNGQVLRSTSISNRSSRLQFASPTVNRQTSPLQTTSAVDIMSNSDMGDCSNSFDSRSGLQFTSHIVNGRTSPQTASTVDTTLDPGDHANSYDSRTASGYIECVFHPSHSVQPEQQESPSSRLMQPNDTLDSTFPEEETKAIVDNFPQSLLQEQIASGSCVTWDEKSEIVEPKGHQSDRDEAPETLLSNSDTDTHEGRGVDLRNVDQMDTHEGGGVNLRNVDQIDTHEGSGVNLRNVDQMDTHEGSGVNLRNVDQMDTHEGRGVILRIVDQMNTHEGRGVDLRNVDQMDTHEGRGVDLSNVDQMDKHEGREGRGVTLRIVDQMNTHEGRGVDLRNVDQMDKHEGRGVTLRNVDQMDTHEGRGVDLRNVDQMDTHEGRGVNLRNVDQMNTLEGSEVNLRNVDQIYTHEGRGVNLRNVDQMDTHEGRGVNLRNDDHVDGLHENSLELMSGMNQIDDIESETDNYMDALNTIESESENDIDCQTKREVELYNSDSDDEGIDVIHELPVNSSDHNPPELESHTASYISSNEGMLSNIPNSDSPESFAHEHIPQMAKISPNLDHSVDNDSSESSDILDDSNSVSVSGPISSASEISDFRDPSRGKIISGFFKSQETPADISGVHSNTFWTNGGLLGLEPSKPPDFTMQNAMKQDSVNRSKDETVCLPAHGFMLRGDEHEAKQDILAKKAGVIEKDPSYVCSTSCQDGVSTKKTDSGFSPVDSDSKCEISVMAPKTVMPVAPDMKSSYAEGNQENDENSSLVFGLSRRLLANGLYKKVSLVHHDNPEPVSSVDAVGLEQCSGQHRVVNQTIPETTIEEQLGHGSPVDSLTSSPPLEHMKISFHPLNGFETSKLKLKFPDGNQRFEGMRDMFPSFQLVPEPDIPLNEFVSESDDDTFCRSSPSKSDDCLSHHSESNSEQWESGEIPEINNLELYDALCRIPSGESMSSSMDFVGTANNGVHIDGGNKSADTRNGVEPSLSGPFLDLPNFDTVNPVLLQKTNDDPNLLKLEYPGQPTPQPPPLPPAQWRMSKPHVDVTEDEEDNLYEALKSAFDLKLLGSAMFQQPKPAPAKQQDTNKEANIVEQKSKQDQQKLNGQKEANQAVNGTEMDERGDFLQQIRSKSFNLRRTVTAKPTNTPAPTNVQVTAILEKANAIRQAVGSDDGDDDDTWSDA
ncbi:protein SCAR3 isoform X9 [Quercus robur]|uniref:protein SCAR3 isoform X9 n=1 Tax=Quercus robur TaxID=38942 RepID=UPI002161486B|nr:protein SCAR3 isoform X9 [Quercus robur]